MIQGVSDSAKMCPKNQATEEKRHSADSGASVDEERDAQNAGHNLQGYEIFLKTKQKIAAATNGPEKVMIGDFDHKTELLTRVSGGSFGEVYLGRMNKSGEKVAVKIEPQNFGNLFLLHEGNVYRELEDGPGIPRVHWFGLHGNDYSAMVMDLLGPTLFERFEACGSRFSLKTVIMLVDQMVQIMEHVHKHNFVHRDISPNNFMFGVGEQSNKLFLIDFGHAKKVNSSMVFLPGRRRSSALLSPKKVQLVGTPRFVSVFAHIGHEPAVRDDMESLAYVWLYLLKGRLLWQGTKAKDPGQKMAKIAELKITTPPDEICKDTPEEFLVYLEHIRSLGQYAKPDYAKIRHMFQRLAAKRDIEFDDEYDWVVNEKKKIEDPLSLLKDTREAFSSVCVSENPISH